MKNRHKYIFNLFNWESLRHTGKVSVILEHVYGQTLYTRLVYTFNKSVTEWRTVEVTRQRDWHEQDLRPTTGETGILVYFHPQKLKLLFVNNGNYDVTKVWVIFDWKRIIRWTYRIIRSSDNCILYQFLRIIILSYIIWWRKFLKGG